MPVHTPKKTAAKKTHPESAKACVPESKTPMVQPSEIIEPKPKSTPPINAVVPLTGVVFAGQSIESSHGLAKNGSGCCWV